MSTRLQDEVRDNEPRIGEKKPCWLIVNEHKTDVCRMGSGMMNPGLESRSRVGRLLMNTKQMSAG